MKKAYIYILIHSDWKMFKIWKTISLKDRIYSLKNTWWDFLLEDSYLLTCDLDDVNKLENMIHIVLKDYRIKLDPKYWNGYTEFFIIDWLSSTLSICNNFANKSIILSKWINTTSGKKILKDEGDIKELHTSNIFVNWEKVKFINEDLLEKISQKDVIYLENVYKNNKYEYKLLLLFLLIENEYPWFNLYKISNRLLMKFIKLGNKKYTEYFRAINNLGLSRFSYSQGSWCICFKLKNYEKNLLYTKNIPFFKVMNIKNVKTIFFLFFINRDIKTNVFSISYNDLRLLLLINYEYERYFDFKRRILYNIQKDLKHLFSIKLNFEEIRYWKTINNINFSISTILNKNS